MTTIHWKETGRNIHLYSKLGQLKRNNIYSLIKVCVTANKCVFMPKMFWSTAAKEKLRALWNNTESIHRGGFEKEKNSIFILSIQVYLKYITSEALSMLASIQQSIFCCLRWTFVLKFRKSHLTWTFEVSWTSKMTQNLPMLLDMTW